MTEECPLCSESFEIIAGLAHHLKERHGIDPMGQATRKTAGLPAYTPAYEWGDPFWEISRSRIPLDEAEEKEPHHGEVNQTAVDEDGNPVNITPQGRVANETRRNLKGHGVDPQYIRIHGPDMKTQYTGSPIPTWAVVVIIAAAIIAVIGAVYFAGRKLYDILVSPLPDWLKPYAGAAIAGGLLLGGGYLTYKVVT